MEIPKPDEPCPCRSGKRFQDCHIKKMVLSVGGGDTMLFKIIGGHKIYRPRPEIVEASRSEMGSFLTKVYPTGTYEDKVDVQGILHRLVDFYGEAFDSLIPQLASRSYLEFLLWQYDQCGHINKLRRTGEISGYVLDAWATIEKNYGRTLKYIAERITMLAPNTVSAEKPSLSVIDSAYVYAEALVRYCILSDQTILFPTETKISIVEEKKLVYIDHELTSDRMAGFNERVVTDTHIRQNFFDGPNFELDSVEHAKLLDPALKEAIGVTYSEALTILSRLRAGCTAHPDDPWETKFVLRDGVIKKVAEMFNKTPASIEKLLAGFWLTQESLLSRAKPGQDIWKPKAHYRAYRRALFVMPHELGPHMAFSNEMFSEALTIMRGEVCYEAFPNEWQSAPVKKALGKLATNCGTW